MTCRLCARNGVQLKRALASMLSTTPRKLLIFRGTKAAKLIVTFRPVSNYLRLLFETKHNKFTL